jgi:hypothetical protein
VDDLSAELNAAQITEMVLRGEGLDRMIDDKQRGQVARMVEDWLFDPCGRGASSGLPR